MARLTWFLALLACLFTGSVVAEDARSIADKMRQAQINSWEGVNTYLVQQSMMGQSMFQLFERDIVLDHAGNPVPSFRLVPIGEIEQRRAEGSGFEWMSADDLDRMAEGHRETGEALGTGIEDGLANAGLPRGLISNKGSGSGAPMNPGMMMDGMSGFLDIAADARRAEGTQPVARAEDDYSSFIERAKLLGRVEVDGRSAFHLRADKLDYTTVTEDGQKMSMHTAELWVDTQAYVPLRFKMDGTMTAAGETRPVTIERLSSDYRKVPGSKMYEPYRQVMRITGQLDPEQQKQMEEARAKLADMEKQMATMPESQRNMIMGRMGPQLAMMRSLAAGGGVEVVTEVQHIEVNPTAIPAAMTSGFGPAGGAALSSAAQSSTEKPRMAPQSPPSAEAGQGADDQTAAQQACLEKKIKAAEEAQQKKRGLGKLMGAVTRVASRFGHNELGSLTRDIYSADATAEDLSSAARDLGLTESDIEACRNPQ